MKKVEELVSKYVLEKEKKLVEIYIKILKKLVEIFSFVDIEIKRVEKLKDGKVSDKKKE